MTCISWQAKEKLIYKNYIKERKSITLCYFIFKWGGEHCEHLRTVGLPAVCIL